MSRYAIVIYAYRVPLARVLETTDRHRAYLRELHARGLMVASGPLDPRTGGALIFRVQDEEELRGLLAQDPFQQESLVDTTIHHWLPNIGVAGLDALAKPTTNPA
jgi:uncharacterized protein YciI